MIAADASFQARKKSEEDKLEDEWDKFCDKKLGVIEAAKQKRAQEQVELQALQAATVEHKSFEELTDAIKERNMDVEVFIQETLEMANRGNDEEWRPQYDAVQNLRVLNKFHFQALERVIDQFAVFLSRQILNLRSSNSRNAMQLFLEMFRENQDQGEGGKRINASWKAVIESNLQLMLGKTCADK